jgi:hypothetical protein
LIYLIALWAAYESTFLRLSFFVDDRATLRRTKVALLTVLCGRRYLVGSLPGFWITGVDPVRRT